MKQRALIIALTLVVLVVGGVMATTAYTLSLTSQQQSELISTLSADNSALRDQVIGAGEIPVAPPAEERIDAAGIAGPMGPSGAAGVDGQDGRSVASLACQADRSWLVTYDDGTTQPIAGPCAAQNGADGSTGAAGPAGSPGAPGAAGEPPASWKFTWLGTDYTCSRSDPFDATAPTYTCNP